MQLISQQSLGCILLIVTLLALGGLAFVHAGRIAGLAYFDYTETYAQDEAIGKECIKLLESVGTRVQVLKSLLPFFPKYRVRFVGSESGYHCTHSAPKLAYVKAYLKIELAPYGWQGCDGVIRMYPHATPNPLSNSGDATADGQPAP